MADEIGAEDLEDGELWLPSDFFSMDEPQPPPSNRCMDAFRRISSSKPLPPLLQVPIPCMPTPFSISKPPLRYGFGTGSVWAGCSSLYQLNPVQDQIETFMGNRARPRPLQNRISVNRAYSRAAHGGTGVFLPSYLQAETHIRWAPRTSEFYKLPPRKNLMRSGAATVTDNIWNY